MHEFPGISENLRQLADILAEDFRVVVPSIFGRDGTPTAMDSVRQLCVRREVHILASDGVSRSVDWLRDLVDEHVAEASVRPYGVIGMCFTGNFALALAVDPRVRAAVVAQPALPVLPRRLGLSPRPGSSRRARRPRGARLPLPRRPDVAPRQARRRAGSARADAHARLPPRRARPEEALHPHGRVAESHRDRGRPRVPCGSSHHVRPERPYARQ